MKTIRVPLILTDEMIDAAAEGALEVVKRMCPDDPKLWFVSRDEIAAYWQELWPRILQAAPK